MTLKINFTVDVKPIPQARPRFVDKRVYEPKCCANYKNFISYYAKIAMRNQPPTNKPVKIYIKIYRNQPPTSRNFGDFDNHAKAVCDALNGIVYLDDSQIIDGHVQLFQSQLERVIITVTDEF